MSESKKSGQPMDRWLNIRIASKHLTLARSTVYRLIQKGKLRGERLPGRVGTFVRESEIERYIKSRERGVRNE